MKVTDVEASVVVGKVDWPSDYSVQDTVRSEPGEIGRLLGSDSHHHPKEIAVTILGGGGSGAGSAGAGGSNNNQNRLLKHIAIPNLSLPNGKNEESIFVGDKHPATRHRHGSRCSRKLRRRVIFKNGDCNVYQTNISKRRRRYLADIFTTLVDIKWRWTLLVFLLSFMLSWLGFAIIWWIIAFSHGDLEPNHLPPNQVCANAEKSVEKWRPCVMEIYSFASCFLFSIETQHTIGYGSRHTTEECPEAIFIMCMQSILGVMIQALMVGIVFAKISRPKKRTQTLMFSRNAVLCLRDGQMCLMFRVGDMRKSHIVSTHVRAQLIRRRSSEEGELLPYYQHELRVGADSDQSDIFFIWPMIVVHRIDRESPLYHMSASDLLREKFEIVVILEGVIESTGMTTQARSSYLPNEILWGHRFEPMVSFRKEMGGYAVDYSVFNNTYEVDTPLCSSKDLQELRALHEKMQKDDARSKERSLGRLTLPHPNLSKGNRISPNLMVTPPPIPPQKNRNNASNNNNNNNNIHQVASK